MALLACARPCDTPALRVHRYEYAPSAHSMHAGLSTEHAEPFVQGSQLAKQASASYLDLSRARYVYVLYGVKYIDPVCLAWPVHHTLT